MTPLVKKLRGKRQMFVIFYIGDPARNAANAAIKAGYSKKTAAQAASRLLNDVNVSDAINEALEKLWESSAMSQAEANARLTQIARQNIADYIGDDGVFDIASAKADGIILHSVDVDQLRDETGKNIGLKLKVKGESQKNAIDSMAKINGWNAATKLDVDVKKRYAPVLVFEDMSAEEDT
jgi:phage terminase small subunit